MAGGLGAHSDRVPGSVAPGSLALAFEDFDGLARSHDLVPHVVLHASRVAVATAEDVRLTESLGHGDRTREGLVRKLDVALEKILNGDTAVGAVTKGLATVCSLGELVSADEHARCAQLGVVAHRHCGRVFHAGRRTKERMRLLETAQVGGSVAQVRHHLGTLRTLASGHAFGRRRRSKRTAAHVLQSTGQGINLSKEHVELLLLHIDGGAFGGSSGHFRFFFG